MPSVLQDWVHELSFMQQSVLLAAIRGPDGISKYSAPKLILRWFRRCVLIASFEKRVLSSPCELGGGSFTGPSCGSSEDWVREMDRIVDEYIRSLDAIPHHFQMHLMHAAEIVGYKHPNNRIRVWWASVYLRLVRDLHLHPETEEEMDKRLGDDREGWLARSDRATTQ